MFGTLLFMASAADAFYIAYSHYNHQHGWLNGLQAWYFLVFVTVCALCTVKYTALWLREKLTVTEPEKDASEAKAEKGAKKTAAE
jgi:hypothetical protein